jgi:hypothetical protein
VRRLLAVVAASAILASACTSEAPPVEPEAAPGLTEAGEALEEEIEEQTERTRGREEELEKARRAGTLGLIEPVRSDPAPGWRGEELWHPTADDWEPAVAGRPGHPDVYMLTTRYGGPRACPSCPSPAIMLRISRDGGRTWQPDRFLCRCPDEANNQYDPEIEIDAGGNVYAVWLDDFTPGVAFIRSDDRGRTWTDPVHIDQEVNWSDKPILAVSDDGEDVYVAFNGPTLGDNWVSASHDGGDTWLDPVRTKQTPRYYFAGGGFVARDGTVVFSETSYTQDSNGQVRVVAVRSADGGQTWQHVEVDRMAKQPDCVSEGCPDDFYGPQAALAGDRAGNLVIVYNGARVREGRQRIYARRSVDGGVTWGPAVRISPLGSNAAFPAAVGAATGRVRIWYQADRKGPADAWNTWFRRSNDGGLTWSPAVDISDAGSGTVYKTPVGYREPYGDYGEIAVIQDGDVFAAWGEGISYFGPGGTWYNRTRG